MGVGGSGQKKKQPSEGIRVGTARSVVHVVLSGARLHFTLSGVASWEGVGLGGGGSNMHQVT